MEEDPLPWELWASRVLNPNTTTTTTPIPQPPLRARHCRECGRCVRRYDHHCPWMENCVGERNHPLFLAYLTLQLLVLLWGVYLAWWVLPLLGG